MRAIALISVIMLLCIGADAFAASWDNGGGADSNWSNALNWNPDGLPTISTAITLSSTSSTPIINSPTTATGYQIRLGAKNSGAFLTMNSGTFNVGEWLMVGIDQASRPGTFTMNDGSMTTGATNAGNGHLWIGYMTGGTFTMNAGTVSVLGKFGLAYASGGSATVHLNAGTINAAFFSMRESGGTSASMDINNGTLVIDGDVRTTVNGYVTNGWITVSGPGTLTVDYNNINPGKTTVLASVNLSKARNPYPADNAVDVARDTDLNWMPGTGAISHDVYFGTTSPGTYQGNQTGTTFSPGVLDYNAAYYWRIDEVNGPNVTTGDVWTFRAISGLAKNPDPPNGAMNVALDKVLSWTAGPDAATHDVYFGTNIRDVGTARKLAGDLDGDGWVDSNDIGILTDYWLENPAGSQPYAGVNNDAIVNFTDYALMAGNWFIQGSPWFMGNTKDTNFSPELAVGTTYYWRVDEVNSSVNRKGEIWTFTTTSVADDNYSLIGKVMCGYQGWFNTPTDGAGRGWVHWGSGDFSPTNCTVDMWPDMTEMNANEKFFCNNFYDGNSYYVFSPYIRDTVLRHFKWMQDYGIDGVYLQRFATEVTPGSLEFNHRNTVLSHCRDGANLYDKKYAVMYDLSGLNAGGTQVVIDDWKYLIDTMKITRDANDQGYMRHNGKPVVALWGFGFGRAYEGQESYDLLNFFKNDPVYGGNTVIIGVNNNWQTSIENRTLMLADIISPWTVGRYNYGNSVSWITSHGVSEKNWCTTNHKDYLPVIWPGFSWHNLKPSDPFNQYPRYGGQYLWDQARANISIVGANMLYLAMFDEVDEGTAIFKVSNNPPRPGGVDMFVTYNMDGYTLPSDEYLWLTGQVGRGLRGEITINTTRPAR